MAERFIGNRQSNGLNRCGQFAHPGRRIFAPQTLNIGLIGSRCQRLCFLTLDNLLECILESVTELNAAHGQQYIKAAVDKLKMKHLICGGFIWLQSCWQLMDAKWTVAPSFLEDAVNLIEKEGNAVFFK